MISVIIPVYNAENSIEKTINSILEQTYELFEIIIVNDGSQDNSLCVCNELSNKDDRIHVFDKKNGGVGSARNYGIIHAKGKYITFVDADDYLETDALMKMSSKRKGDSTELIFGEYAIVDKVEDSIVSIEYKNELPVTTGNNLKREIIRKLLQVDSKEMMMGSSCRVLINLDFLRSSRVVFDEKLKMSEDLKFILGLVCQANSIDVVKETVYYYVRVKGGSATQKYMESMYLDMRDVDKWKEEHIAHLDSQYQHLIRIGRANTYIVGIINNSRPNTPLTIFNRIQWCKKYYNENKSDIKYAIKYRKQMRRNHWIGCLLCRFHLFAIVVFLHALHNKTI